MYKYSKMFKKAKPQFSPNKQKNVYGYFTIFIVTSCTIKATSIISQVSRDVVFKEISEVISEIIYLPLEHIFSISLPVK